MCCSWLALYIALLNYSFFFRVPFALSTFGAGTGHFFLRKRNCYCATNCMSAFYNCTIICVKSIWPNLISHEIDAINDEMCVWSTDDYLFNRFLIASRTVLYLISQFLSIFSICLCFIRSKCALYLYLLISNLDRIKQLTYIEHSMLNVVLK